MNENEEPFLISVDLSKVLQKEGDAIFTMFIDHTKMTIVYEVKEWIRWMFSLPHCLNLVHQNTMIHDLEDIKILAKLKKFELNFCGVKCFHQNLYQNILDKLGFYVSWNQIKVPKFFIQKLNSMNQKLNHSNFSKETIKILPQDVQNETSLNLQDSCNKAIDFQTFTDLNNSSDLSKCIKPNTSQVLSKGNEVGSSDQMNFELESQSIPLENNKTQLSSTFANCVNHDNKEHSNFHFIPLKFSSAEKSRSSNFLSETKQCDANEKKKNLINAMKSDKNSVEKPESKNALDKVCNNKKKKKFIKPFSLAEVVASLQKAQNQTSQPNDYISEKFVEDPNEIDLNHAENSDFGKETEIIKKKRKRIRKNKNKNLSFKENWAVTPTLYYGNNYNTVGMKASSHIRFPSTSENEEDNTNESKNSESKTEVNDSTKNFDNNTAYDYDNHKPIILQSTKENILPITHSDNFSKSLDNLMDCAPAVENKEIQKENDLISLNGEINIKVNNNSNGSTLINPAFSQTPDEELSFLKKKFPFPVVFERFS